MSRDVYFKEEVASRISRGSHMEIDSERQEDMVSTHPSTIQRETIYPMETVEHVDLVDYVDHVDVPWDIAVGWKRPT
jgi:hypothetical protein